MNKAKSTHKTFSMLLAVAVLTVLIFLPRVQKQQIAASAQPTATPVPGNDVVEFLAQIVPGTTRWSEISATLIDYGLSPYATYNDQGQVRGYGIDISEPRLGITMPPYTQEVSAGIGVDGDLVRRIQFYFNFINEPTPSMPEVQWANIKAVFARLGVPSHLRISVSQSEAGEGSVMEAYWQDSGWYASDGIGISPNDYNGGIVSLCYIGDRTAGLTLGRVAPGTPLETMDMILENIPGVRTPLEPNMLLNASDIATVRHRILNDECLKTRSDYWFVFVPEYVSPTPWATDTPTPTATLTPTNTFTPTPTLTPTVVPTSTPTATIPARFSPLRLRAVCSPLPALFRVWRVENDNRFALPFTWQVVGTRQDGHGVALARFDSTFFTATVRNNPNTVRILVRGVEQDVESSISTQCR